MIKCVCVSVRACEGFEHGVSSFTRFNLHPRKVFAYPHKYGCLFYARTWSTYESWAGSENCLMLVRRKFVKFGYCQLNFGRKLLRKIELKKD